MPDPTATVRTALKLRSRRICSSFLFSSPVCFASYQPTFSLVALISGARMMILWPFLALNHCMAKGRSGSRATFSRAWARHSRSAADDCDDGEEVSRVRLRYPKHLMSCTIALAHTLTPSHTVRRQGGQQDCQDRAHQDCPKDP